MRVTPDSKMRTLESKVKGARLFRHVIYTAEQLEARKKPCKGRQVLRQHLNICNGRRAPNPCRSFIEFVIKAWNISARPACAGLVQPVPVIWVRPERKVSHVFNMEDSREQRRLRLFFFEFVGSFECWNPYVSLRNWEETTRNIKREVQSSRRRIFLNWIRIESVRKTWFQTHRSFQQRRQNTR